MGVVEELQRSLEVSLPRVKIVGIPPNPPKLFLKCDINLTLRVALNCTYVLPVENDLETSQ